MYPSSALLLPPVPLPDAIRPYLVDWDASLSPAELATRTEPLPKPPGLSPRAVLEFNSATERLGGSLAANELFWYDERGFTV